MRALKIIACGVLIAASQAESKTLTIGVDLSSSNPLVVAPEFARVAAGFVQQRVSALQLGDVVVIRTFGERSMENVASEHFQITRRERPDKVAGHIGHYIAAIPAKNLQGQGSTNIAEFFEFGSFGCMNGGEVLLLTDGIESSDVMDAQRFLSGKPLPVPEKGLLSGCAVTMFGLGQSAYAPLSAKEVKTIRASWTTWMKAAGARFSAVIDP